MLALLYSLETGAFSYFYKGSIFSQCSVFSRAGGGRQTTSSTVNKRTCLGGGGGGGTDGYPLSL